MNSTTRLRSTAWLLRGISSVPGQLELARGRLSFTSTGTGTAWPWQLRKLERDVGKPGLATRIDSGQASPVFDAPLDGVLVTFPWYYFSGGLKVRVGTTPLRFSLGTPPNTRMPVDRSDPLEAIPRAIEEMRDIGSMRAAGKAWKMALLSATRETR